MSRRPLITVFGATGAQGGALARALLCGGEREFRVRAVTRQPGGAAARALSDLGAEICAADLDDASSVQRAMHDAHGAFCACPCTLGSPERGLEQAGAVARAAELAGLRHLIWSSHAASGRADPLSIGSGLPVTRLQAGFVWDHLIDNGTSVQRGADGRLALVLPTGDAVLPGIAAADIGACAAALLRRGAAVVGHDIGIAGEHSSGAQMAAALGRALGEPVHHVAVDAAGAVGLRLTHDVDDAYRAACSVEAARALHPQLMGFDDFLRLHSQRLAAALQMVGGAGFEPAAPAVRKLDGPASAP